MKKHRAVLQFREFVKRHSDPMGKHYEVGGEMYSAFELLQELDDDTEISRLFIAKLIQGKITGINFRAIVPPN